MKRAISLLLLLALLMVLPVLPVQASELGYVTDAAELLTYEEWQELENLCSSLSDRYGCGVYIVTVDDYTAYGSGDVFDVTYGIYHSYAMGKGAQRNGLVLLLSMEARDFALFVYGEEAEYAFDDYGQAELETIFLPYFGEDDWYGGFQAYAQTCGEFLSLAEAGEPVRADPTMMILIAIAVAFLISLVVVNLMKLGMRSVRRQTDAQHYRSGALNLTVRHDQYTHTTETRRKIETNSGSGTSRARIGGGGSGRSGKF